jgi:heavy metal sensor kinase
MDVYHLGQTRMFQITQKGAVAYQTEAWKTAPWTKELNQGIPGADRLVKTRDGHTYMLKNGSVPEYGFEITSAYDATANIESIQNLAWILIAAIPCTLVLALAGGYFLAGRVLSPVKAITRKAREIRADRLSERLPVSNPGDEIGQLAAAFNETLPRLEESFERLRRFTADASHELRTPLTSMRSVGEVALQGPPDSASCREAIGSMLEEIQRVTQLVDDLLTLARGDSDKAKLTPCALDLSALVGEVVDELGVLAEEKSQVLSTAFQPSLTPTVDRVTLRQAISNVLHNAIQHTPREGRIEIRTMKIGDGQMAIDIIDNGPGIPESERARVFERFYRLDKARSRKEGGFGLGLAIAQWAVELNGGTIGFHDKEGPGAWCRIILPGE